MTREVLVVDDDPVIRETLADVVADEGFAPLLAENGLVALDRLHRGARPCLILLDLMMPVMDGWAFIEKMKEDPRLGGVPIAVLSASEISRFPPSVPLDHRIRKPFTLDAVLDVLEKHCPIE